MTTVHADIITVAGAEAAKEELTSRKDMLPEVSSAYVQSGRCPAFDIVGMGVAAVLGGILATAAAGIALVLAWVFTLGL